MHVCYLISKESLFYYAHYIQAKTEKHRTDMIDRLIQSYRKLNRITRHVIVILMVFMVLLSTLHALISPASALTRTTGTDDPAVMTEPEGETQEETAGEDMMVSETEAQETDGTDTEALPDEESAAALENEPVITVPEEPAEPDATAPTGEEDNPSVIPEEEANPAPEPLTEPIAEPTEEPEESDPEADTETAADWENMFREIELTGVWAEDLITLTETQIGYTESEQNFILDEDGFKHGYTRYGGWYGNPYAKWDSLFILFNLYYAGITQLDFPYQADCEDWLTALKEQGFFRSAEGYVPLPGDLVFADADGDGQADHAAIVKSVIRDEAGNPDQLVLIEGDADNAVRENTCAFYNPLILGFAKLPENPALRQEENVPEIRSFTGSANRVDVTVLYEEDAFPEGTTMQVKAVWDRPVINAIQETVNEENREIVRVQAVDITFLDAEGSEIEPSRPIQVTMKSNAVPEAALKKPVVVHVDNAMSTSVVESATPAEEPIGSAEAVTFEAGAFSVYAMVYTIETYYTTYDGNTYRITLGYNAESGIPEDAQLDVREILPETEEYDRYLEASAAAVGLHGSMLTYSRFFDIRIMNNGEKIEPAAAVSVTIELDEMPENPDDISIVHFGKNAVETIDVLAADSGSVSFEADSFSVYSVISSGTTSGLAGKSFALINRYTNNAMQSEATHQNTRLAAEKINPRDAYITANNDLAMWTFTSAPGGLYYIQTSDGQYLHINGNSVTTSNTPQALHVTAGTGDRAGRVRITNDSGMAVNNYEGATASGFGGYNDSGNNEWFTLYELEEVVLNPDYAAEKISVQDIEDGQRIILYKSVYNEATEKYEDYVIDGNGELVKAYDKGDQLVGRSAVSPVWTITMHRDATTHELNGYYDFYNEETGMYLSPKSDGTVVSSVRPGVTLNGRRDGGYISTIEAWDNSAMAYYGLEYVINEDGEHELKSGTGTHSQELSFAAYITREPDELHPVNTVDSVSAGITIHMFNYPDRPAISDVTGSDSYSQGVLPAPHASNTLTDGYPMFQSGTVSGSALFEPGNAYYKGTGNRLFLESVYNSTGYYEYNAFNNFAHFNARTGTFTVYQETGTPSNDNQFFYQRGNFFPYNDLNASRKATNTNRYEGDGSQLDIFDPTDGGPLYMIQNPDFYFGMTVEATFMQPKNGTEKEGPVVYEFNGDDDLWIYIDGVLVLDIGGVHDAFPGMINFATGEIIGANGGAGKARTIKDAFRNAGVFPDGTAWDESKADQYFKGNTFADYGSHTFKMFYMEHGAGASNLEMRFNLPVIEKGRFTVEKVLDGTNQQKYSNVYFAYQAFKKNETVDVPLTGAVYEGTANPLTFYDNVVINGKHYDNVFYLKPGQAATFPEMADEELYYVQELGIGTDYYDQIIVNDVKIDGVDVTPTDGIYPASVATVGARARVTYANHCSEKNLNELRITKRLSQDAAAGDTTFEFRVLLENANGELKPYSIGEYYIQNDDGDYFRYVNGKLTNNGKTPVVASVSGNNGTIAGIPRDFTVVIKDLLAETDFYVEEIRLPEGWELLSKEVVEDTCDASELPGTGWAGNPVTADGQIRLDTDAQLIFTNEGKQRIVVNKEWQSGDFVTTHGNIQVALFKTGEDGELILVEDSIRTITAPDVSVEYVVDNCAKYTVREITVTGTAVTPVDAGGPIEVRGETTVTGADATDVYLVTYEQGEVKTVDDEGNPIMPVRTDTITNRMPVLTVNKTDLDGHPLKDAVFTLLKADKITPVTGYERITSTDAENGNLLNAIHLSKGTYYLKELSAPGGYHSLAEPLRITAAADGTISIADTGSEQYEDLTPDDRYTFTFEVVNTPGVELPGTGGIGTGLFRTLGGILILGAGVVILLRKQCF